MRLVILNLCVLLPLFLNAQNVTTGQIKSAKTDDPIKFCNINKKSTNQGTSSDKSGHFKITTQPGDTLLISHIGFYKKTIVVKNDNNFYQISLKPKNYSINAITINGYAASKNKSSIKSTILNPKEVEKLTNVTKDPMRSVLLIPGVSNNNSSTVNYNVRGGSYNENRVLINGSRTYKPYHFASIAGPASISVFNYKMVDNIKFLAGGFSAEYGDALSSVMDIKYRKGGNDFSGMCKLSMTDGNIMLEGPISEKITYLTTFRKSYFGYIAKLLDSKALNNLGFYDWQGTINYDINNEHNINFTFLHSKDQLEPFFKKDISTWTNTYGSDNIKEEKKKIRKRNMKNNAGVNFFSLNWNYNNKKLKLENIISFYKENSITKKIFEKSTSSNFPNYPKWVYFDEFYKKDSLDYQFKSLNYKINGKYYLTNTLNIKSGFSIRSQYFDNHQITYKRQSWQDYYFDMEDTTSGNYFPPSNDTINYSDDSYKSSAFFNVNKMFSKKFFIDAGLRMDYYSYNENLDISPRFQLKYKISSNLSLKGATGLYTQTPYLPSMDKKLFKNSKIDNQKAIHYILGLEKYFDDNTLMKIEPYYKDYLRIYLVDLAKNGELIYGNSQSYEGFARGIDIFFNSKFKFAEISLSYELGESKIVYSDNEGKEHVLNRYSDQRHTLSSFLNLNLGKTWELSIKYFYGSGYAYTPKEIVETEDGKEWQRKDWHTSHYPASSRTDLLVSKQFNIFDDSKMKINLEIMNLFSRKNVLSYDYYKDEDGPYKEANYTPFDLMVPSLGISFQY